MYHPQHHIHLETHICTLGDTYSPTQYANIHTMSVYSLLAAAAAAAAAFWQYDSVLN